MKLYDIPVHTLSGEEGSLAPFEARHPRGKRGVQVRLTPQYAGLEELQKSYESRGFSVVGFPCNQFMGQEPARRGDPNLLFHDLRSHLPLFERLTSTATRAVRSTSC